MNIASLLSPELILCGHSSSSKKRLLEDVAKHISEKYPLLDTNQLLSALVAREKLGSTGIGNGIAIPHCRIAECEQTIGMLITLNDHIDFNAIDDQPVDIIFALLVPEHSNDDHLKTLAAIANIFSQSQTLTSIRNASNTEEVLAVFK